MRTDRHASLCVLLLALLAPTVLAQTAFNRHFPADHTPVDIAGGVDHLPYVADSVSATMSTPRHEVLVRLSEAGDRLGAVELIGHSPLMRSIAPIGGVATGVLFEGASGGLQQNPRVPYIALHDPNLMTVWTKEVFFGFPATQVPQLMPLSLKADPNNVSFVMGGVAWTDPVVAGFPWFARVRWDGTPIFVVSFPQPATIAAVIMKVVPTFDGGIIGVGMYQDRSVAGLPAYPFAMKVNSTGNFVWARTYQLIDVSSPTFAAFDDIDNRVEHGATTPGTYVLGNNGIVNSLGQTLTGPFTARIDEVSGDLTDIKLHLAYGHRLTSGSAIVYDPASQQIVVGGSCTDVLADGTMPPGSQQALMLRSGVTTSGAVFGDFAGGIFESEINAVALNPSFGSPVYDNAYLAIGRESAFLTSPDRFVVTQNVLRARRDLTGTDCSLPQAITSLPKSSTWTNLQFGAQSGTLINAGMQDLTLAFDLTSCTTYPSLTGTVPTPGGVQLMAPRSDRALLRGIKALWPDLSRNQILHGVDGADGTFYSFYVDVPPNTTAVTFSIAGNNGDADLYVRRAGPPTFTLWDWRPYTSASNESVTVNAPAAGRWYFAVHGYRDYRGLTIRVQTW